jgi:DNA uptake protein ComE-like DNA-binding protein
MAPEPDPASDAPGDGSGDEAGSEWPGEDAGAVEVTMAAASPEGLPPAPPRLGVRMAELEERLARLEEDFSEGGPEGAAAPTGDEAAAIEELRRAIVALEARVDANVARLQKVEAADAARLRRFDAEVRKISAAATAGLRQALEEAAAASADAQRLTRTEPELPAELQQLRAELDRLRADREADQELLAVLTERFRDRPQAAAGELLDLNAASAEELRALGISGTQATRVIAAREEAGGFSSLDELDALSGFPPAQLEAFKAAVRI